MKANGGTAPYTVTDQVTGEVRAVNWYAPALNTVLYRFDEDEVTLHPHLRPARARRCRRGASTAVAR